MGPFLGLKSFFGSLSGLDIVALSLAVLFIIVVLPHLFLYWLVRRANKDGFYAELKVPSILFFKIRPISRRRTSKKQNNEIASASEESFGRHLRRLRLERRITLHQLGRALHLQSAEISKLENGSMPPTAQLVDGIAICLELSEQELVSLKASAVKR